MKRYFPPPLVLLFFLVVASQLVIPPARAKTAWKWRFDLLGQQTGKALLAPTAVFIDSARQRYYVVDNGNNRLLSFDRTGKFMHVLTANNELKTPAGMARDHQGNIWVIEKGRNSLTRIDLKAKKTFPHELEFEGNPVYPGRLSVSGDNLYVLDKASGNILVLDNDLKAVRRISHPDRSGGIIDFVPRKGGIWALVNGDNAVYHWPTAGGKPERIALSRKLRFPYSLDLGPRGLLYVLDRHAGNVAVFDPAGRYKYSFLAKGQFQGRLYYPAELRFAPWGGLSIVDEGNGRVEVFER